MRDLKLLQHFWRNNVNAPLILATLVGKRGSSYRAPRAKKIIRSDGQSAGMLSGGCLEDDITRNALDHKHDLPCIKSFSTMSDEDRLMGYQTGCAGVIEILFEHLPQDLSEMEKYIPYGENNFAGVTVSLADETLGQRSLLKSMPEHHKENVFFDRYTRPVNLYIIGCGADAYPFADLAPALGWNVTFLDYRDGFTIENTADVTSRIHPLKDIAETVPEGQDTAVVVMTHNYEADLDILRGLNGKKFGYLGCIGPRKRFQQIKSDLKKFHSFTMDADWAARIHAPAGLKKARTPETIALAIVSEIEFYALNREEVS